MNKIVIKIDFGKEWKTEFHTPDNYEELIKEVARAKTLLNKKTQKITIVVERNREYLLDNKIELRYYKTIDQTVKDKLKNIFETYKD